MNSEIDQPLDAWQESFYPLRLRQHLKEHSNLLGEGEKIIDGIEHPSSPFDLAKTLSLISLSLMLFAGLTWRWRIGKIAAGLTLGFWGLFSGVVSSVMSLAWILSEHSVLAHNANLWLFWPVDFFVLGFAWALIRNQVSRKGWYRSALFKLAFTHMLAGLLLLGLYGTGFIVQDVSKVLLYLGTVMHFSWVFVAYQTRLFYPEQGSHRKKKAVETGHPSSAPRYTP